jgi:RNA polymerase sigma-70 factor (ECF subfamily)
VDTETSAMALTQGILPAAGRDDHLARARRGELAAFDQLMREHEARVFSIALRFTGRRADAEEITQDVFVKLHGTLGRITDADHLRRWLLRTVTHRCLNRLRDERRRPQLVPIESMPTAAEPAAPESGSDPLAGPHLRRLLLELAPEARVVVLLRFQEDLDPSDIAVALDMSVNTVKSHLRRSLDWLRAQCIGEIHED